MKISSTVRPEEAVLREISGLVRLARASHPACPGFPGNEETERTWLARDDSGKLLAFLAVCRPDGDHLSECVGITRPEARRKGVMRALLDAASPLLDSRDVLFSCDGEDPETKSALLAIGAEPAGPDQWLMGVELAADAARDTREEHLPRNACRPSSGSASLPAPAGPGSAESKPALWMRRAAESHPDGSRTLRYRFTADGLPAGEAVSCRANLLPGGTASFGEFLVAEKLRGRGIGAEAFARVLLDLRDAGARRVILHVDSGNIPAVRLYKKAGFRVLETLSVYFW